LYPKNKIEWSKIIVDKNIFEDNINKQCFNCGGKMKIKKWKEKGKGPSPDLVLKCLNCKKTQTILTSPQFIKKGEKRNTQYSETNYKLAVLTILTGSTYEKIKELLMFTEIKPPSKSFFYATIIPDETKAVQKVLDDFLFFNQQMVEDPDDLWIILDTGWSHPGWWANECTVVVVDGKTGLPIAFEHVIKGKNYEGSSKGT
jgi:hypothetical protein